MDGFDLNGLMGMFGGVQQRIQQMKDEAADRVVEGTAGGLVTVKVSCDYQVHGVQISADAMEDRELLEDLVRAAIEEAHRLVREENTAAMSRALGGLPIPPGMIPGFP